MDFRELLEPVPVLAHFGARHFVRERIDVSALDAQLNLLLSQWERELEWDQSGDPSLAEEIICTEVLTVVVAAVVLAMHPDQVFAPLGEKIRKSASRHAELRERALQSLEANSTNLSSLLKVQRLRRRISRWIDRLLEPVLASIRERDEKESLHFQKRAISQMLLELEVTSFRRVVPNRRLAHPYRAALLRLIISTVVGWLDETRLPTSGPQRPYLPHWHRALFKQRRQS